MQIEPIPNGLCIVFPWSQLTEANGRTLAEELADLGRQDGCIELRLDLRHVEQVSDFILLRLVVLDQKLRAAGTNLTVVNVRPEVLQTFATSGLSNHIEVHPADEGSP